MVNTLIFTDNIERSKSREYILSIQVRLDGFSFDIFCPEKCKHIFFKDIPIALEEHEQYPQRLTGALLGESLLSLHYQSVHLTYCSPQQTLVPLEFFEPEQQDALFKFNHLLEDDNCTFSQPINDIHAQLIFSIPQSIYTFFNEHFAGATLKHPLEHIIRRSLILWTEGLIHIHINATHFELVISKKQQIRFINSYSYTTIEDIIYYITALVLKLNMNRDLTCVILSGYSNLHPKIIEKLTPYFCKVSLLETEITDQTFIEDYIQIEMWKYYPLFC